MKSTGPTPESLSRSGSEFGEQSALFCWLNSRETRERFPDLYNPPLDGETVGRCKMFANYNNAGNDGDKKTAAIRGGRAKQTGSKKGVADIFLPLQRHGVAGLFLELKIDPQHPENLPKRKRGRLSPEQAAFGRQVIADGYGWAMVEGWKAAARIIEQYMTP